MKTINYIFNVLLGVGSVVFMWILITGNANHLEFIIPSCMISITYTGVLISNWYDLDWADSIMFMIMISPVLNILFFILRIIAPFVDSHAVKPFEISTSSKPF